MSVQSDASVPAVARDRADELGPRRDGLIERRLSEVEPEMVDWLWPGRFPRGKLSLLIGDPGDGKSLLTLDMAARVSTGAQWCDGGRAPIGDSIFLANEDGLADTMRPRLDAASGNPHRVTVVQGVVEQQREQALVFSDSVRRHLEDSIVAHAAVFVVVDPLTAYLGKTDAYKDAEVRGLLTPLATLAERTGAALLGIMHLNKDEQRRILYRQGGSVAFTAIARTVQVVTRDPNDRERRLLVCSKTNIGRTPSPLAFRIEASSSAPDGPPRLIWEPRPADDLDIDALFAVGSRGQKPQKPSPRDTAATFLRAFLWNGPQLALEVQAAAGSIGIAEATLRRAKDDVGVSSEQAGGGWWWCLPGQRPPEG